MLEGIAEAAVELAVAIKRVQLSKPNFNLMFNTRQFR